MPEINLLAQPGRINRMVTRNRIVMSSAHSGMAAPDGNVTDQLIAYYSERGRGGAGIVNIGFTFINQEGRAALAQTSTASDDKIPGLRRLTETFHSVSPAGSNIGAQLCHVGRCASPRMTGVPCEAPSPIPNPMPGKFAPVVPVEMSVKRIAEVVDQFDQAARRSKAAGFDLVEIHAAHGYLLNQFISTICNQRTDEYGGSIEKRMRMVMEVMEAVRGNVGPDYPVGIRINADDFVDGGYTLEEYQVVAQMIENSGLVDYISVSGGFHHPDAEAFMVAPMSAPLGFLEYLGAGIRQVVESLPVMIVGRIKDPVYAEGILQRGSADYCIMTRPLMADPELPNKVMEGRLDDIRPCIACMQGCTDRTWSTLEITCLTNPAAGRERTWARLNPAPKKKRVLVVGGGPAGMEAARVAALRGHDVTLWEQADHLGGKTLLAAMPPRREELADLPRWLAGQLPKAGVRVELNRKADALAVRQFAPDVLVAATGAYPEIPEHIPGWNQPHITTVQAVLSGAAQAGARVLVVGHETQALECAEWLAEQGKKVYLISATETPAWNDPQDDLANDAHGFVARNLMMGFVLKKVEFLPYKMVKAVVPGGAVIARAGERHPCTTATPISELDDVRLEVDTVIIHLRQRPNRAWMAGLEGAIPEIHKIGDCLEPRHAIDAMADGGRVGREI